MTMVEWVRVLAGVALFSVWVVTGLVAQPDTDSPQRVEQRRADLSGAPHMEVIASTAEYKPGESLALHLHYGIEAAYVVQGASVQAPGKTAMTLPAGATIRHHRDIRHAGFRIVGDNSLKLFTVHIVDKGKPLYDYAQ